MNTRQSVDPRAPNETLWRNAEDRRHFIVPEEHSLPDGGYGIRSIAGVEAQVDPAWLVRYEVTENEANAWAKQEFGIALGEIRRRIDAKLGRMRTSLDAAKRAPVRPEHDIALDALPALLSLARALPRAIFDGLSGDSARLANAQDALGGIGQRLNQAGIVVGDRMASFPGRLNRLRTEAGSRGERPASPSPGGRDGDRS